MSSRMESLKSKASEISENKKDLLEKKSRNELSKESIDDLRSYVLADDSDVTSVEHLGSVIDDEGLHIKEKTDENDSERAEKLDEVDDYISSLEKNLSKLERIQEVSDLGKDTSSMDSTKERIDELKSIREMLEGEGTDTSYIDSVAPLQSDGIKEFKEQYKVDVEQVKRDYSLGVPFANVNLKESYKSILKNRYNNSLDKAKTVFDIAVNSKKISVIDGNWSGGAHYYPNNDSRKKGVYYNASYDESDIMQRGQGSTFFHEIAHMIDHSFGEGSFISSNIEFRKALKKDAENIRWKYETNPVWADKFQKMIDCDPKAHSISDMIEGLTDGEIRGAFGHIGGNSNYWNADKYRICNESFAHFFEASMGNIMVNSKHSKLDRLKMCFPNAYKEFENLLTNIENNNDLFSKDLVREI